MELEIRFQGTPAEFGTAVDLFARHAPKAKDGKNLFSVLNSKPLEPRTNPVRVHISSGLGFWHEGVIIAHSIPDGQSLLTMQVDDNVWKDLEEGWTILLGELKR